MPPAVCLHVAAEAAWLRGPPRTKVATAQRTQQSIPTTDPDAPPRRRWGKGELRHAAAALRSSASPTPSLCRRLALTATHATWKAEDKCSFVLMPCPTSWPQCAHGRDGTATDGRVEASASSRPSALRYCCQQRVCDQPQPARLATTTWGNGACRTASDNSPTLHPWGVAVVAVAHVQLNVVKMGTLIGYP